MRLLLPYLAFAFCATTYAQEISTVSEPTKAEADIVVMRAIGPTTLSKGSVTITVVPDTSIPDFKPKEHLEPYKPGFKEKLKIRCGSSVVSISSNNHYYTRTVTYIPVAEWTGGVTIRIENNSDRTMIGSGIPIKQSFEGHSTAVIRKFGNTELMGEAEIGNIPQPLVSFPVELISPKSSASAEVYLNAEVTDQNGKHIPAFNREITLSLYDVPIRVNNVGAVLQKSNFSFTLRVDSQHITKDVIPVKPEIVCKTD